MPRRADRFFSATSQVSGRQQMARTVCAALLFIAVVTGPAVCGEEAVGGEKYVSRAEYESLVNELRAVKAELAALKKPAPQRPDPQGEKFLDRLAEVERQVARAKMLAAAAQQGTTKMVLAGDMSAGFTKPRSGSSTFSAGASPMVLWQIDRNLLAEVGLEFNLNGPDLNGEGSETDTGLDSANVSYLLTDWLAVGAGKFGTPFASYHNHLDPPWINKLPDDPLVFGDGGMAPDSAVGVFATGAFAFNDDRQRLNYAAWVSNGPALVTEDADAAGTLNFDNWNDQNNNKAVGGRVGFMPMPGLEVGYSVLCARASPPDFGAVHAVLHGLDLNYVQDIALLKGRLTARGAWIWSHVGEATYDPTGELGFGPKRYANDSTGGYLEVAYRPTQSSIEVLKKLEFVLRYDYLDVDARIPGHGTVQRWTPGVAYWLAPNAVLKAAWQCQKCGDSDIDSALVMQIGLGL